MTTYQSAEVALADVSASVPNVVVCDLSMPSLDGLAFMLRLRARSAAQGGRVPAIAITAYREDRPCWLVRHLAVGPP